jgi:transmembrane sensor
MPDFTQYNREDFLADESFVNYLLQNNPGDIQYWENWIKNNPQCDGEIKAAALLFFLIKDQKESFGKSPENSGIEKQYARLQSLLKTNISDKGAKIIPFSTKKDIGKRSIVRRMAWRAAAVAAVFLTAFFLWNYFTPAVTPKTEFIAFAKTDSSTKEITLPDGSLVQLNSNSSVEISKDFNHYKREVMLTGSAFFKVYKDHSKPFTVSAGNIKTTALGTAFYIYNLSPQSISVSLLEGKVKVEGNKNYVELLPGEKAVYNSDEHIYKDSFSTRQLQSFTTGKIQFEHANLREIKTILAEYFNKEIVIEGNAPKVNFTGNFESKKIETILEALQFTYNIHYKSEGQKVIISFN